MGVVSFEMVCFVNENGINCKICWIDYWVVFFYIIEFGSEFDFIGEYCI